MLSVFFDSFSGSRTSGFTFLFVRFIPIVFVSISLSLTILLFVLYALFCYCFSIISVLMCVRFLISLFIQRTYSNRDPRDEICTSPIPRRFSNTNVSKKDTVESNGIR